jgi:thiamine biosynthesis lipoprotein
MSRLNGSPLSVFQVALSAAALLPLLLGGGSCATPPAARLERFEFKRPEMGMEFRIVLYASGPEIAAQAATNAFDRIRSLNAIFSDYEENSELTKLSLSAGTGRAVPLSPELWDILERAQALATRTQGAFDVTVGPYVSLWRRARRQVELPRADLLEEARKAVGYRKLLLNSGNRSATLTVARMRLDLGGIAKGYALDDALRVLQRQGIRSALVSGGGDMVFGDAPPGKRGWRIQLAPLDAAGAPAADYLEVARVAVSTSGDLYQHVVIDGRRYSHIVDPATGLGLTDHSLVTVIAADSTTADGLSTSISVLGPEKGLELARAMQAETRIVRRLASALEQYESKGFKKFLRR